MSELTVGRAAEIASFFDIPVGEAERRLSHGFEYQHARVNEDFRRVNPQTDEQLLDWYRTTEEYIWELTAYHIAPGCGYMDLCNAIADRLQGEGAERVLCLGDGIGDLTIQLDAFGLDSVYHDLDNSRTSEFFKHRADAIIPTDMTPGWTPYFHRAPFDAVVSLDFMEHVTDVPGWCEAIYESLRPGGIFVAQNAFDCGSGLNGSIPMHLDRNDRYAHATPETNGRALWDHLLFSLGFQQLTSNWYKRP